MSEFKGECSPGAVSVSTCTPQEINPALKGAVGLHQHPMRRLWEVQERVRRSQAWNVLSWFGVCLFDSGEEG